MEEAILSGSEQLGAVYTAAAKSLPDDVEAHLTESLRTDRGVRLVTLISREKNPFTPMSAPIHKLLIAHAMNASVVTHHCGLVTAFSKDSVTVAPCGTEPTGDVSGVTLRRFEGQTVLRHGATPTFRHFFPNDPEVAEDLIKRQKLLAANLDAPLWGLGDQPLKAWPPPGRFGRELQQRRDQAATLVSRITGSATGTLDFDEMRGFLFSYQNDAAMAAKIKKLPDTMFGFPLVPECKSKLTPAETRANGSPPSGATSAGSSAIGPGTSIVSNLDGRLGPIFSDPEGRFLSITVAHLAPPGIFPFSVRGREGGIIGTFLNPADFSLSEADDIGIIALEPGFAIEPGYAGHPCISGVADPRDVFASEVYVERDEGNQSVGYVSSTRAPVFFRLPGSGRRVVIPNAVRIRSSDPSSAFASLGDSGAPVVDAAGRLLGLVLSNDSEFTYVLPIGHAIEKLGLQFIGEKRDGGSAGAIIEDTFNSLFGSTLELLAAANRRDQDEAPLDLIESELEPSE
jgi:hypothetical protein